MKDFCCGARVGKWQIVQKYSGSPTRARVANDFRQAQIVSWDSPGDQRRRMKFYQRAIYQTAERLLQQNRHDAASQRAGPITARTYPAATAVPQPWDNVVLFEHFYWSQLRDKVSSGPLRERLREVGKPQRVVDATTSVSKKEARGAYEEILQVVEQLYAENGL